MVDVLIGDHSSIDLSFTFIMTESIDISSENLSVKRPRVERITAF